MLTSKLLAATIVAFCKLTPQNMMTPPYVYCFNYILNCSVDENGDIKEEVVEECKKNWIVNEEELIK